MVSMHIMPTEVDDLLYVLECNDSESFPSLQNLNVCSY